MPNHDLLTRLDAVQPPDLGQRVVPVGPNRCPMKDAIRAFPLEPGPDSAGTTRRPSRPAWAPFHLSPPLPGRQRVAQSSLLRIQFQNPPSRAPSLQATLTLRPGGTSTSGNAAKQAVETKKNAALQGDFHHPQKRVAQDSEGADESPFLFCTSPSRSLKHGSQEGGKKEELDHGPRIARHPGQARRPTYRR